MAPSDVLIQKLTQHSPLAADDLARVARLTCVLRELLPNEDFIHQGDRPRASAIVVEGFLARYHMLASGKRQYLSLHLPGDWPDAQGLFLEEMDHSVCAIGPAVVCAVPHEELLALFRERPTIAFAVWRETLIDASIFREAITNNSSRDPVPRLAHLFCEMYFRAKQIGMVTTGVLPFPLNQTQIGEMLGMALVSVNRNLKRLRKYSAVDFKGGQLIVHDWNKLSSIGEFDPTYLHQAVQAER
ncbi:MAG TPA: Crp/Fnr family transcriptional regulator [Xanthobacteraceae bacterium]|jgi:CRP-like cAMP-binding protein